MCLPPLLPLWRAQYYTDLLETLEMDQDDPRGGLTPDATPYNEQ